MPLVPKVIGFVPVYKGEKFVLKTLEALAQQSYPNFEIIICDDASPDGSWEVCKEFCSKDSRFSLIRNTENKGWFSTSQTLWLEAASRSRYCFINPHDDIRYPEYISELVKLLEENPSAGLSIPGMENRYWDNSIVHSFYTDASGLEDVVERCFRIVKREKHHWWAAYQGMYRSEFVQKIYPIDKLSFGEPEFSLDLIIMLKTAFFGSFVTTDQILLKKFYHKKSVSANWSHNSKNKAALWLAIFKEIRHSPLSRGEKMKLNYRLYSLLMGRATHRVSVLFK